jgi:hypothetical protein
VCTVSDMQTGMQTHTRDYANVGFETHVGKQQYRVPWKRLLNAQPQCTFVIARKPGRPVLKREKIHMRGYLLGGLESA